MRHHYELLGIMS